MLLASLEAKNSAADQLIELLCVNHMSVHDFRTLPQFAAGVIRRNGMDVEGLFPHAPGHKRRLYRLGREWKDPDVL
jgi:hypothetical protein